MANGGFESGSLPPFWSSDGDVGLGPGRNSAHGAWLGGANDAGGELMQRVAILAGANPVRLEFWWLAEGETEQPGDFLDVIVQHEAGSDRLRRLQAVAPLGQWHQETLDLTAYAGQTVGVTFRVSTDGEVPTTFRLDDVSVKSCGEAVIPSFTWTFGGTVNLVEPGTQGRPLRGAQVSIYGSESPSEPGPLLATAHAAPDGTFILAASTYEQGYFPYYFMALNDPNYEAVAAIPGPGGEAVAGSRIRYTRPEPGDHFGNRFDVRPSRPEQVPTVQPLIIPMWFAPPSPPGGGPSGPIDLFIQGIEVTQGIQCFDQSQGYTLCPDNSLELTSGKHTFVRVYIGCTGSGCQGTLSNVRVGLTSMTYPACTAQPCGYGFWSGPGAPQYINAPLNQSLAQKRDNASATANYFIEPTGAHIVMNATVNADEKIPETNYKNNDKTLYLWDRLVERKPLDVKWVLIDYTTAAGTQYPKFTNALANAGVVGGAYLLMRQMYPMWVNYSQVPTIPYNGPDVRLDDGNYLETWLYNRWKAMSPKPDVLFGWLPPGALTGASYIGRAGGSTGYGEEWTQGSGKNAWNQSMLAHEIGHTRGLDHPNSGEEKCWPYGTDPAVKEVGFYWWPASTRGASMRDFMAQGANDADMWISPYMWSRLSGKAYSKEWAKVGSGCASASLSSSGQSAGATTPSMGSASSQAEPQPAILVSGRVWEDGSAELDSPYQFAGEGPFDASDPRGDYSLDLQTATGESLARHYFKLTYSKAMTITPGAASGSGTGHFTFVLPMPADARRIVLRRGETILIERVASPNAPIVAVVAPQGGEMISGKVTLAWTASDEDGDTLHYAVEYTPDGGASWSPIAFDLTGTSLEVDTASWPGGAQARIRLLASDGFNTTAADSASFQVTRKAPSVWISTPESNATIHPYAAIVLTGHAEDMEDGELSGANLTWRSDRQGVLGNGAQLIMSPQSLAPGWHQITLIATDSDGQVGSARVNVFVGYRVYLPLIGR
ncbi:MAG TPA: hypothetical protein DEP84_07965 [Chloroflexi bacterium]|nr:hypothetical protein [Chloroflexota bacterium]